ncbi:MAG: hypothetical protein ABH803_01795 [Candidatus Micrarchaeota archaeon]
MKKILFLLLLTSFLVNSLSLAEATSKATSVIGESNDIQFLNQPLDTGDDRYWVFFYSFQNNQRVILAISDYEGTVVTNKNKLEEISGLVYDYLIIQDYLKPNNWDFDSLKVPSANSIQAIQQNSVKITDLISIIQNKYDFDLTSLENSQQNLLNKALEIDSRIIEGVNNQQNFEATLLSYDLEPLILNYNDTLKEIIDYTFIYDDYKNTITSLQSEVFKSDIPDPDNKNIYDSLEALLDVGISEFYSMRLTDPVGGLNRKLKLKDAWINDSTQSFFFLKNKKEANEYYNEYYSSYSSIIQNEYYLTECGLENKVKNLSRTWSDIEALRAFTTSESYYKSVEKLLQAKDLIDAINQDYTTCINPTPTSNPQPTENTDYGAILIAVLVGALALIGYNQYEKMKKPEEYT